MTDTNNGWTDAVVGLGGGGGWLVQLRLKSPGNEMVLVDGDVVTESNLDRQMFDRRDVGKKKVLRMADKLRAKGIGVRAIPEYLRRGGKAWDELIELNHPLRIFACPDNHPCRVCCMELADERRDLGQETVVLIAGNELAVASGDVYFPEWFGTNLDFRVRYPEVLTDFEGDPLRPSCTGDEVQAAHPQLALFNSLAAHFSAWLARAWTEELPQLRRSDLYEQIVGKMPVSVTFTNTGIQTKSKKEIQDGTK